MGHGRCWTEAPGEGGGGWGHHECERFLKAGVGMQSSEGSPSSLALRIQEELGVGGAGGGAADSPVHSGQSC